MAETDGLDIVGLRLSVVYGAGRRRGYMTYPSERLRDAALGEAVTMRFGDQRLHWQYVEEVAEMTVTALLSQRRGGGEVYNAFGDCRSWRDAAAILRSLRPELRVEVGDEVDQALAGTVEDCDSSGFARNYQQNRKWPLEKGIADTLETYRSIIG